jgi:photosystem II stability/assembly factor-like uncharacterized protein
MKKFSFFLVPFLVVFLSILTMAQTNFWEKVNGPFDTVGTIGINAKGTIFLSTNHGVFRSTDNGTNWRNVDSNLNAYRFAFNPIGDIIFAIGYVPGVYGGIFRSTDDGANWTKIYGSVMKTIAINDSGYIFIGVGTEVGGGVDRSTDNGASWINTGLKANSYALAINASGTIFSGGWYQNGGCIFRSTDNGASWTNTSFSTSYLNTVNHLDISPGGHIFAGTFSEGVYRSTDDGANWTPVNTGLANDTIISMTINSNDNIFAGTFGKGVFRSTDEGANWTSLNSGLTNDTVFSLAINPSGTIFGATTDGLFRSVQPTTSVKNISADAPKSFSLYQNYPNPFNPSTAIKYAVPFESNVNVRFYNSLGQIVHEVNEGNRQPGNYEINFNSSGLASGIYFYSLKAVSTDGMILVLLRR